MTAACSLPPELGGRIRAQEMDRFHIPAARSVLERAVIAQMQSIAEGLLAHRLLGGQRLDHLAWVAQFLSRGSLDIVDQWGTLEATQESVAGKPDDMAAAMRVLATAFRASIPMPSKISNATSTSAWRAVKSGGLRRQSRAS